MMPKAPRALTPNLSTGPDTGGNIWIPQLQFTITNTKFAHRTDAGHRNVGGGSGGASRATGGTLTITGAEFSKNRKIIEVADMCYAQKLSVQLLSVTSCGNNYFRTLAARNYNSYCQTDAVCDHGAPSSPRHAAIAYETLRR